MKTIDKLIAVMLTLASLGMLAKPAIAFQPVSVPEPGVLSLLGLGGVVALVLFIRNRHK